MSAGLPDRFWAKVTHDPSGCWLWTASVNSTGYPCFGIGRSRSFLAHRVAYSALVGPIPDGHTIDHLCRNKLCVNPAHLEAVTAGENTRRAASHRPSKRGPYRKGALASA